MSDTPWSDWSLLQDYSWDHFVTVTFPKKVDADRALKLWRYFTNKLSRKVLPAGEARREGMPWVASAEPHREGGYHVHALIKGKLDAAPNLWMSITGSDDIVITPYDSSRNALSYMTKAANECVVEVSRFFTV